MNPSFTPRLALRACIGGSIVMIALGAAPSSRSADVTPSQPQVSVVPNTPALRQMPLLQEPLRALLGEALKNNPEIAAARNEYQAAAQRIAPAGALDDPMLEAGVLNVPTSSFSFSREDMTMKMLGLSQRLPYPGKRGLKRDIAVLDAESVAQGYNETQNRVLRDAMVAYYDLALVSTSARLVWQNREIVQQLIKVADSRYSVGQGNQVDVFRAQTQLSKMAEELIKLNRERATSAAELSRVLGNSRAPQDISAELPLPETSLAFDSLLDEASQARPQLLGLRAIAERAQRSIELAGKDRYPDFDVRFSYGQRDRMPDGARRSDMVSLTVAMNLPVWRQTKTLPRIAEAVAMQEQAEKMYQAQRNELAAKLRQQISTAEQSVNAARLYRTEIIPQARLTVEAATAAYQVGRSEFALLLDNQMAVLNFQIAEATAAANYNKALAEIDFLTGRIALYAARASKEQTP